jgi:hypothetical protein
MGRPGVAVLRMLFDRGSPLVVIAFGDAAADTLRRADVVERQDAGCAVILRDHPARADAVLARDNPFVLCNAFLETMASSPSPGSDGGEAASYDFIVIGGGSAGCVLANRLSADPDARVLLLEAGGRDRNPLFRLPMLMGKLFQSGLYNWHYTPRPSPI